MKIYSLELRDDFNCITSNPNQVVYTTKEDAEKAGIESYDRYTSKHIVYELDVRYSHRNGETEDPTVDGWYWVEWAGHLSLRQNPVQNSNNDPFERYYGPIPEPEI